MYNIGRPLKFKSVEELQQNIDDYFKKMDEEKRPYTISGLALSLDTSRRTLLDYRQRDEFSHSIKMAKSRCEAYAEELLLVSRNAAGVIFNLKNNYNWVDRQEISNVQHDGINELNEDQIDARIEELSNLLKK